MVSGSELEGDAARALSMLPERFAVVEDEIIDGAMRGEDHALPGSLRLPPRVPLPASSSAAHRAEPSPPAWRAAILFPACDVAVRFTSAEI